jgi:hypothetical protein
MARMSSPFDGYLAGASAGKRDNHYVFYIKA